MIDPHDGFIIEVENRLRWLTGHPRVMTREDLLWYLSDAGDYMDGQIKIVENLTNQVEK